MDLKRMNRLVVISSAFLYSVNIILSISLYSVLSYVGLPIANVAERSILISVPLISGIFNAFILTMIVMSLKLAEYYGMAKSVLALIIYSAYILAFSPPIYLITFMVSIMVLSLAQLLLLYYYAKLQKLMFG